MTIRELIDQLREIGYKHGWDVEVWTYDDDEYHEAQQALLTTMGGDGTLHNPGRPVVVID